MTAALRNDIKLARSECARRWRLAGWTYRAIGVRFGVTPERALQLARQGQRYYQQWQARICPQCGSDRTMANSRLCDVCYEAALKGWPRATVLAEREAFRVAVEAENEKIQRALGRRP